MLNPSDLLEIAGDLVAGRGRPSMTRTARSISSVYYAMFHRLARDCADLMIGTAGAERSLPAWGQVYRALDHGTVAKRCRNGEMIGRFPSGIRNFATVFVSLQAAPHSADYDPFARFSKSDVSLKIERARTAIDGYRRVGAKDRRAFCAYVLFPARPGSV